MALVASPCLSKKVSMMRLGCCTTVLSVACSAYGACLAWALSAAVVLVLMAAWTQSLSSRPLVCAASVTQPTLEAESWGREFHRAADAASCWALLGRLGAVVRRSPRLQAETARTTCLPTRCRTALPTALGARLESGNSDCPRPMRPPTTLPRCMPLAATKSRAAITSSCRALSGLSVHGVDCTKPSRITQRRCDSANAISACVGEALAQSPSCVRSSATCKVPLHDLSHLIRKPR